MVPQLCLSPEGSLGWFLVIRDVRCSTFRGARSANPWVNGSHTGRKAKSFEPCLDGKPGQGGAGCFLLIGGPDVNQRSRMFRARVLVLLDSSNWTLSVPSYPQPGELCLPWLSLSSPG